VDIHQQPVRVKRKPSKGIKAWLITWEGDDAASNGRCKVVSILPYRTPDKQIKFILPILFCSEYNLILPGKMALTAKPENWPGRFVDSYDYVKPKYLYGEYRHEYLFARVVEDLRCEETTADSRECTLTWTEPARYIPVPGECTASDDPARIVNVGFNVFKRIEDETQQSYTYRAKMD